MYCKNCGNEIADGSKFCSHCGSPVTTEAPQQHSASAAITSEETVPVKSQVPSAEPETDVTAYDAPRKPVFEEFQWNVEDYPARAVEKTEDIDFDWSADPREIPDTIDRSVVSESVSNTAESDDGKAQQMYSQSAVSGQQKISSDARITEDDNKPLSAADRIDKFYTFNRKNEEFQQLLNKEYEKVKSGNSIKHELSKAEELANQKFESIPEDSSMEAFLEREGIVKPYQPKAFESDVLQRIEAQEAEKEAKRLEEEARLAAIEEARKEAEAEAQKKAAEEARIAAEEEAKKKIEEEARVRAEEARIAAEQEAARKAQEAARLKAEEEAKIAAEAEAKKKAEEEAARLQEIARRKAEEEAKLAEEARIKAEAEAKLKAEEEARLKAEEEAKMKAEAEAKVKAAEEARLKAEADLKAAQEAAKIRAQQEARLAAEAEAKFKAEQERKQLEAIEAQKRLEEQRRKIAEEANQAVAQEEVRKVIEQTARMRDEEAAKIRATVAAMRDGIDNIRESSVSREVEEAHQATKNQINEMANARHTFFAELEADDIKAAAEAEIKDAKTVTGRETMLSDKDLVHTRTVDKAAIMAGLSDDTIVASKKANPAPESDEEFFDSLDNAAGEVEELQTIDVIENENPAQEPEEISQSSDPQPIDFKKETDAETVEDNVDDLLLQFESVNHLENPQSSETEEFKMSDTIQAGNLGETFKTEEKPGLNETVVMPRDEEFSKAASTNDFDNYGNEEAADYIKKHGKNSMDDFYGDGFYGEEDDSQLSKKELRRREKEQKRLEKEKAKEAKILAKRDADFDNVSSEDADDEREHRGGKGRLALKIVLVILIVILAVEVVGMGVRFIAPQSKAAEFIDNQLNKVIHLITGDDTEYSVIAAQVRTEPMEDKTDLINSQKDKNTDKNIKSIVYSSDLGYDDERDGKVSDLVLSQPMTQVEWGKDEDNYPVYYDEQVIGEIIAFESNKVNLMNKGDEKVLDMIKSDTKFYTEVAALKDKKTSGTFEELEIGEIRQAGKNYYVWVRETIGGSTEEKVYVIYPEKEFVMKISACYVV